MLGLRSHFPVPYHEQGCNCIFKKKAKGGFRHFIIEGKGVCKSLNIDSFQDFLCYEFLIYK